MASAWKGNNITIGTIFIRWTVQHCVVGAMHEKHGHKFVITYLWLKWNLSWASVTACLAIHLWLELRYYIHTHVTMHRVALLFIVRVVYHSYDNRMKLTSFHLNKNQFFSFLSPHYVGVTINDKVLFAFFLDGFTKQTVELLLVISNGLNRIVHLHYHTATGYTGDCFW